MSKKGTIKLETVLVIIIALTVLLTVFAAHSYYTHKISESVNQDNIVSKYTKILLSVREDALMTAKADIIDNNLILKDKNNKLIAHYKLVSDKLIRDIENPEAEPKILIDNVNKLKFWINTKYPNLLSMYLETNDEQAIPFFTSFALRCYNNE